MYTVYSRWLAYELRKRGFKIEEVQPNPNKSELDCYLFQNSENLQSAIRELNFLRKRN